MFLKTVVEAEGHVQLQTLFGAKYQKSLNWLSPETSIIFKNRSYVINMTVYHAVCPSVCDRLNAANVT